MVDISMVIEFFIVLFSYKNITKILSNTQNEYAIGKLDRASIQYISLNVIDRKYCAIRHINQ